MRKVAVYDQHERHMGYKDCPKCNVVAQRRAAGLASFGSRSDQSRKQTFAAFNTRLTGDPADQRILEKSKGFAQAFANGCVSGFKGEARWLILFGERGVGKSHLCAAVDNHLADAGASVLFITMADMLNSLKNAIAVEKSTDTVVFQPRLEAFKTAPVLLLDDVGAESQTEWSAGILWEVLDHRYRLKLPTMIATNLDLNSPDPRMDQRVVNRMQDTRLCVVQEMPVESYRLRKFQTSF